MAAQDGQLALGVEGRQLLQGAVAIGHQPRVRRVDEGEGGDVAKAQQFHLQDDGGQVGALDLGLGIGRPCLEIILGIKADADAGGDAPAAPLALVGGGLGDALHRQALNLAAMAVAADAGEAGVDDKVDARHRQGGLGDIGGQHHPPGAVGLKDPGLLRRALAGVEGQDLGGGRMVLAQGLGGLTDLALAGEEYQDIATPGLGQFIHRLGDGQLHGLVALPGVLLLGWPVAHLHRVGAAADLDDGCRPALAVSEMAGEALGIDGGGGDDDLEVRPPGQEVAQVAEQEVDIKAALMGLVDDQGVVLVEEAVLLDLRQQDAVGHQLDTGLRPHPVMETYLVAHQATGLAPQFLGNPAGQGAGRDTPRLGVADAPEDPPPQFQADLGQLGGLAGAGLAAQHHNLMAGDEVRHLGAALANRQLRWVVDRGDE